MDNISASTINELFVQKLNSPEGLTKVAQEGSAFIRSKLREVSFARKIIQPWLLEAQERKIKLREWPEGWEAAIKEAKKLVNPWIFRSQSRNAAKKNL